MPARQQRRLGDELRAQYEKLLHYNAVLKDPDTAIREANASTSASSLAIAYGDDFVVHHIREKVRPRRRVTQMHLLRAVSKWSPGSFDAVYKSPPNYVARGALTTGTSRALHSIADWHSLTEGSGPSQPREGGVFGIVDDGVEVEGTVEDGSLLLRHYSEPARLWDLPAYECVLDARDTKSWTVTISRDVLHWVCGGGRAAVHRALFLPESPLAQLPLKLKGSIIHYGIWNEWLERDPPRIPDASE